MLTSLIHLCSTLLYVMTIIQLCEKGELNLSYVCLRFLSGMSLSLTLLTLGDLDDCNFHQKMWSDLAIVGLREVRLGYVKFGKVT